MEIQFNVVWLPITIPIVLHDVVYPGCAKPPRSALLSQGWERLEAVTVHVAFSQLAFCSNKQAAKQLLCSKCYYSFCAYHVFSCLLSSILWAIVACLVSNILFWPVRYHVVFSSLSGVMCSSFVSQVSCVSLTTNDALLATGQTGGMSVVRVWNFRTGECLAMCKTHTHSLHALW